ncbi:MAG TPA: Hsp20/alpha crystallin family protein, partial [Ferruginibacter sp.]|nr:Hsp20/alpha crystallin family protein [Ferruginibacter sp.]
KRQPESRQQRRAGINQQYHVPVNITETDNSYEMQLVAPGLKKEDFKVNLEGDLLTISYEHKEENSTENKGGRWLRKEYRVQAFSRSFTLDEKLDPNKISAQYLDGVLHLSLPKKEGAQRLFKTIEIK